MSGQLYRSIDVWRRKENAVARYRCFQVLPNDLYCVQSVDFYRPPFGDEKLNEHNKQFLELLVEDNPESRSGAFPSLADAITAFDREFGNQAPEMSRSNVTGLTTFPTSSQILTSETVREAESNLDLKD